MNPKFSLVVASVLALCSARAGEFKFGTQTFTLPDGFTLERVAGPGLVDRPIEADFDEQGRLYVTDSSGSNEPTAKQLENKPHRVMRLEDTDGDGIFDKSTVFADKMMFPEGAMWFDGSLYVSAVPVIWKLTDTDGDGVADKREEWLDAKTLTGCANDLHGPYLGLDGWIYWCKGAFAKQTYEQPGGKTFQTRAAHIFRRRPEGGFVEPVMTGGMDNPVGVVFTPEGERIFTTTFFQHPGGGQRDGLIHAIYGGVYGKVNDVTDDHKKTGELMPVLTHLGPAAPCGLARYESEVFGKEYKDNLFACLFNLHKVTRHVLQPYGGSFKTVDLDFLTSDSTDFHPTDVIEDADGSLLVIDTGGWYKICCPTSQLWKPDVLGAIYRIRRTDAARVSDPRGTRLDWKSPATQDLVQRLNDARPAVARRAVQELRKRTDAARELMVVLKYSAPVAQERNAIWALTGSVDPGAKEALRIALRSSSASVQHSAVHAVSVMRDEAALEALLPLLKSSDAQVRRATAEALGRLRKREAVKPLLEATRTFAPNSPLTRAQGHGREYYIPDRILEHSIIFALIEIDQPAETRAGLNSDNPDTQRAALIALDQMENGGLTAQEVTAFLDGTKHPLLNQTANWIIGHRKEWGAPVASYLEAELLNVKNSTPAEKEELEKQLQNLASSPAIQRMLASVSAGDSAGRESRFLALEALKHSRAKDLSDSWFLVKLLRSEDPELVQRAAAVAGAVTFKEAPAPVLRDELLKVAGNNKLPDAVRLEALNASASGRRIDPDLFTLVRSNVAPDKSMSSRTMTTAILAKAKLTDEQLIELAQDLRISGPLEISKLVDLYEKSASEAVGRALVSNLRGAHGVAGVHPDRLKQVLSKYPEAVREDAKDILAGLNADALKQAAYIDELLPKVKEGDVRRGQAIFNSTRAACSSCHAIGYLGGNLGPDLTRIGQVRTEKDLLEAIVYPSASFVRSYEPFVVITKDGDDYSGVLRKDAADEVVLGTGPGAEVRIARTDISEIRPGKVSVMPQGLNEQLTQQELSDLLAFLKATRW